MPQVIFHKDAHWMLGIWKITETSKALAEMLPPSPEELHAARLFGSASRRKEWLATRVLLQDMCGEYKEISYRPNGAPYLTDGSHEISISHTKGYAALMLSDTGKVGIDMEFVSQRILKVKEHFLSPEERAFIDPNHEVLHLLICWCAKEAIYKLLGREGVEFSRDLQIQPFSFDLLGRLQVREYLTGEQQLIEVQYIVSSDYVLTTTYAE